MKEFFVGLLVLISLLMLSILAVLLLPFIIVLGAFLQALVYVCFIVFAIWMIGRFTLWGIERSRKNGA